MSESVLLVESPSDCQVRPLGLMKLSTWHKRQGRDVRYQRGYNFTIEGDADFVEIASPDFTWEVPEAISCILYYKRKFPHAKMRVGGTTASDNPKYFSQKTGIEPTIGILRDVDLCAPDYSLFPEMDYSLLYTSRGCSMGCSFCRIGTAVRPRGQEGAVVYSIPTWKEHIDLKRKRVVIQDNNLFGAKKEHLSEVIDFLKQHKLSVDFNSGFEVHQAREAVFEEMQGLKIRPVRTAFDEIGEEKEAERTVAWIKQYLNPPSHSIMVYVLYNFTDTPEDALYRCLKVLEWGACPYVMPYYPLSDWYSEDYKVSSHWTLQQIMRFRRFFDRHWIVFNVWAKKGTITLEDIFGTVTTPQLEQTFLVGPRLLGESIT